MIGLPDVNCFSPWCVGLRVSEGNNLMLDILVVIRGDTAVEYDPCKVAESRVNEASLTFFNRRIDKFR